MPQYDPIPDAQPPETQRRGSRIIAVVGVTGVAALAGFGIAVAARQTPATVEPRQVGSFAPAGAPGGENTAARWAAPPAERPGAPVAAATARPDAHAPPGAERVTARPVPPPPGAPAAARRASRSADGGGGGRAEPRTRAAVPSSAPTGPRRPSPSAPARAPERSGKPSAGHDRPPAASATPRPYRRVPDPCATFYDFRRDYCYRVLDRLMGD